MWAGGQPRSRGAPEEGMSPQLGCDSLRASQDPGHAVGACGHGATAAHLPLHSRWVLPLGNALPSLVPCRYQGRCPASPEPRPANPASLPATPAP